MGFFFGGGRVSLQNILKQTNLNALGTYFNEYGISFCFKAVRRVLKKPQTNRVQNEKLKKELINNFITVL